MRPCDHNGRPSKFCLGNEVATYSSGMAQSMTERGERHDRTAVGHRIQRWSNGCTFSARVCLTTTVKTDAWTLTI